MASPTGQSPACPWLSPDPGLICSDQRHIMCWRRGQPQAVCGDQSHRISKGSGPPCALPTHLPQVCSLRLGEMVQRAQAGSAEVRKEARTATEQKRQAGMRTSQNPTPGVVFHLTCQERTTLSGFTIKIPSLSIRQHPPNVSSLAVSCSG